MKFATHPGFPGCFLAGTVPGLRWDCGSQGHGIVPAAPGFRQIRPSPDPARRKIHPSGMVSSILGLVVPLSAHRFLTLAGACERVELWRRFCGEDRLHPAIGYKAPI